MRTFPSLVTFACQRANLNNRVALFANAALGSSVIEYSASIVLFLAEQQTHM